MPRQTVIHQRCVFVGCIPHITSSQTAGLRPQSQRQTWQQRMWRERWIHTQSQGHVLLATAHSTRHVRLAYGSNTHACSGHIPGLHALLPIHNHGIHGDATTVGPYIFGVAGVSPKHPHQCYQGCQTTDDSPHQPCTGDLCGTSSNRAPAVSTPRVQGALCIP